MMRWSINNTRKQIEVHFGCEHLDRVVPRLNSVAERLSYSVYHYQEIKRLLDTFTDKYLSSKPLLLVTHGGDDTSRKDFETLMIQAGANATACVLSMHAISDILAGVVYHALGYSRSAKALKERDIKLASVQRVLLKKDSQAAIAETLSLFSSDQNYKHVAALANMSKHQTIIRPLLNEDITGTREQQHEFRFAAFRYNGEPFPEIAFESVLEPAYELSSRIVVDVGNMLNTELTKMQQA